MSEFNPSSEDYAYHYKDYIEHTQWVSEGMAWVINQLLLRMLTHDRSKIVGIELDAYAAVVPGFKNLQYGTTEHREHGKKLGPAWKHHTEHNKHHPEHFEFGIADMTLIDLIEMLCDWRAASMRSGYFDWVTSLNVAKDRHLIDRQLFEILRNTCKMLDDGCVELPPSQKELP